MPSEVRLGLETFSTLGAGERLQRVVGLHVPNSVVSGSKTFTAFGAWVDLVIRSCTSARFGSAWIRRVRRGIHPAKSYM